MREIWKDIKGYEGLYQVSNKGRVRSLRLRGHNVNKLLDIPRILCLTPHCNKKYSLYQVYLCYKGTQKQCKIHRLVAQTFIQNPENKPEVNHIDSNPHNNHVENLEWCTRSENMLHASMYGNMGATLKDKEVCEYYKTHSIKETESEFKTGIGKIKEILKRNNIKPRSLSKGQMIHKNYNDDEIIRLYNSGYSIVELDKTQEVSAYYISRMFKRKNVKIRSFTDTMKMKKVRNDSRRKERV